MTDELSNSEACWDEFVDWCEDTGTSLEHEDDWKPWWECLSTAISAKLKAIEAEGE